MALPNFTSEMYRTHHDDGRVVCAYRRICLLKSEEV
jgi:hypothetical protein